MNAELAARSWVDLEGGERPWLAVPLGATEQHGPHLPLDTDTRIAVALAQRLVARRPGVLVAPAVAYGSSGEHQAFPGTLSLGPAALEHVVVELVRSAAAFARGVVLVAWHGGNAEPLCRAVPRLVAEGHDVRCWQPRLQGGDAHAGRTETSLMLALDPAAVRMERASPGNPHALATLLPDLRRVGVRPLAPNGVLGDPTGATADEGRRLLATLTDDLAAATDEVDAADD